MNRFFVDRAYISEDKIRIVEQDDIHHIAKVLRLKAGEDVFVTDGEGSAYISTIENVTRLSVDLAIKERLKKVERCDRGVKISLACAVPKKAHFEDIVDKCTQLGVDEIIPLITERTIVERAAFDKKFERYKKVMISAAKQSGVLFLPQLRQVVELKDVLRSIKNYDLCLIPNLSEKPLSFKDAVANFSGKSILVLIGPEGDFSSREIEAVLKAGGKGVSLGESVLRVDTAAIAVVSYLRLYF